MKNHFNQISMTTKPVDVTIF